MTVIARSEATKQSRRFLGYKTMKRIFLAAVMSAALLAAGRPFAADGKYEVGSFDARMSMGFNYDLLRPLTDVSFRYPVGYIGFNVPIIGANLGSFLDSATVDDLLGSSFVLPDNFRPTGYAGQNADYTVRVDVPMLAGVGTFAYTQNFYMNFNTTLGGSRFLKENQPVTYPSEIDTVGYLAVSGSLRLPLSFAMGWETMTFGYAYKVGRGDDLIFALNLHRHLFSADIRMKADVDILGHAGIHAGNVDMGDGSNTGRIDVEDEFINFSSDKCNGFAQGRFKAEGWTPSVGVRWKRFALNSRFGLDVRAKGSTSGGFVVPQVLDLKTGKTDIGDRIQQFAENMKDDPLSFSALDSIIPKNLETVTYEIKPFRWRMPQGHTISYDIIREHRLVISYTKLFGETAVDMDIISHHGVLEYDDNQLAKKAGISADTPASDTAWYDRNVKVDVGIDIDHILVLSASYPSFFANVGFCGFNVRNKEKYALGEKGSSLSVLRLGDVVMLMPILNGGFNIGTKLQLRVEADVLPLPAVRSGVSYYF